MPSNLKEKVAIITGASSGIGAATAEYFAGFGCFLTLVSRKVENLTAIKLKCVQAGLKDDQILLVSADLTNHEQLKSVVEQTIGHFKKLDILVNSAGILLTGLVEKTPIEEYDRVMQINTRSVVMLTQICIPHLMKTRGTVVNVSSINGPCSFPNVTYYCMSKAAVDQFTKCLALELAPHGVRVNAVNPGVIVTNVHKAAGMNEEQYKNFLEHSKTTHALGRVGDPLEAAKAIGFLASDDSSFTTGDLLRVDGGRGIMTPR